MEIAALVLKKGRKTRKGKGFSREELKKVGLDFTSALRLGIPVDKRRKSIHEENVKLLEEYLRALKPNRTVQPSEKGKANPSR